MESRIERNNDVGKGVDVVVDRFSKQADSNLYKTMYQFGRLADGSEATICAVIRLETSVAQSNLSVPRH